MNVDTPGLARCPACAHKVSREVDACPECGYRFTRTWLGQPGSPERSMNLAVIALVVVVAGILLAVVYR